MKQIGTELIKIAKPLMNINLINPMNDKGQADKEKEKFFESDSYEPQFTYRPFDCEEFKKRLDDVSFEKMPKEILKLHIGARNFLMRYLGMIKNRGTERFTDTKLYGTPSSDLVKGAYAILKKQKSKLKKEQKVYSAEELKELLQKTIDKYGLKDWAFIYDASSMGVSISITRREIKINRSEERRVGKECRSRWSP